MSLNDSQIGKLLAANAIPIIMAIFALGTIATTITMQGVNVDKNIEHIDELEHHKASKADLEALSTRVRRKLDGDLKTQEKRIEKLEVENAVLKTQIEQIKGELKTIWKNYNRLHCE